MAGIFDVLTVTRLKTEWLHGVNMADRNGNLPPDTLYENSIKSAISVIEKASGQILSGPRTITGERQDVYDYSPSTFYDTTLRHTPIRSITGVRLRYGNFPSNAAPLSWILLREPMIGRFQVVPSNESGIITTPTLSPFLWFAGLEGAPTTPGWLEVDYKAGFGPAGDGETLPDEVGTFPPELIELVALYAVLLPLSTAGDLLGGGIPGLRSQSVSQDGVSTSWSIGTPYQERLQAYSARIEKLMNTVVRSRRAPGTFVR